MWICDQLHSLHVLFISFLCYVGEDSSVNLTNYVLWYLCLLNLKQVEIIKMVQDHRKIFELSDLIVVNSMLVIGTEKRVHALFYFTSPSPCPLDMHTVCFLTNDAAPRS